MRQQSNTCTGTCQMPLGKMKSFNSIYTHIPPAWWLFHCQLSVQPGKATCHLTTWLFYLAMSLGLATWSNNLSLDYLHATCFNTILYLNTEFLPILMLNMSHITYHSVLYFYPILLLTIFTLHKICPWKYCTLYLLLQKYKTTRLLTISGIYKKPQLYYTLLFC